MTHVIAIVALAGACIVWYVMQRLTGRIGNECSGRGTCESGGPKKGSCLFCGDPGGSHAD